MSFSFHTDANSVWSGFEGEDRSSRDGFAGLVDGMTILGLKIALSGPSPEDFRD